jgi:hypothetical protein
MSQNKGYSEQIVFKDGEFKIEMTIGDPRSISKKYEYYPLETWNFVKKVETSVLIIKLVENNEDPDPDQPNNAYFYEMPLTFEVLDTPIAKHVYLKVERIRRIINEALKTIEETEMVYVRNLETSMTIMSQPDNCEGTLLSFVKVTRGKAKRITKEKADEIVKSGKYYAMFADVKLEKRIC